MYIQVVRPHAEDHHVDNGHLLHSWCIFVAIEHQLPQLVVGRIVLGVGVGGVFSPSICMHGTANDYRLAS